MDDMFIRVEDEDYWHIAQGPHNSWCTACGHACYAHKIAETVGITWHETPERVKSVCGRCLRNWREENAIVEQIAAGPATSGSTRTKSRYDVGDELYQVTLYKDRGTTCPSCLTPFIPAHWVITPFDVGIKRWSEGDTGIPGGWRYGPQGAQLAAFRAIDLFDDEDKAQAEADRRNKEEGR